MNQPSNPHDPITPNSGGKGEVEVVNKAEALTDRDNARNEVADLLDRIKALEGRLFLQESIDDGQPTLNDYFVSQTELTKFVDETLTLRALLRRIPLGLLRVEEHKQLYIDMCAALNIEPWVEK